MMIFLPLGFATGLVNVLILAKASGIAPAMFPAERPEPERWQSI
jgi:hypothetical protein